MSHSECFDAVPEELAIASQEAVFGLIPAFTSCFHLFAEVSQSSSEKWQRDSPNVTRWSGLDYIEDPVIQPAQAN